MRLYRKTRIPHWYEFYRTPCPICGHVGGCMIHEKGDRVACIRVESEQYFSKDSALPSYLHWLKPKQKRSIDVESSNVEEYSNSKKLDPITLDIVYRTLIEILQLTDEHYAHLTSPNRKLTDRQIAIRKYVSFPKKPWETAALIKEVLDMDSFEGVPGFYKKNNYWTLSGKDGILIPYRNQYNQIVGFQYRLDRPHNEINVTEYMIKGLDYKLIQPNRVIIKYKGKTIMDENVPVKETGKHIIYENTLYGTVSVVPGNRYFWLSSANKPSGTGVGNPLPIHVSIPTSKLMNWKVGTLHKDKTVWLTEGALKADIAVDYIEKFYTSSELEQIGSTMIALPGVGSWRMVLPMLKDMGVETINMCFDSDSVSNPVVYRHLLDSLKEFKKRGYHANLVAWNSDEAKGIDDLFLKEKKPLIKKLF